MVSEVLARKSGLKMRPTPDRLQELRTPKPWDHSGDHYCALELFAEIEALTKEREQWGNEFTAVMLVKQERDALKESLRERDAMIEMLKQVIQLLDLERKNPSQQYVWPLDCQSAGTALTGLEAMKDKWSEK